MSYRNNYRPPRDPHGYIHIAWTIVITFFVLATLAAGFLLGVIWYTQTH